MQRANPTLIGVFVVGAILLAVAAVVTFGSGGMFHETYKFVSFFDGSVGGLDAGAAVTFRGVRIGKVVGVRLDLPGTSREADDWRVAVVFELDEDRIKSLGTQVALADSDTLLRLAEQGIHARLESESLVTGRMRVALDFFPELIGRWTPVAGAPYPEIPTMRAGFEEIQGELSSVVSNLEAADFQLMVASITNAALRFEELMGSAEIQGAIASVPEAMAGLNQTVGDLHAVLSEIHETLPGMRQNLKRTNEAGQAALEEMTATLAEVRMVIAPGSPVVYRLETTLAELSEASRAVKQLAEYLERNPSALVRGKKD